MECSDAACTRQRRGAATHAARKRAGTIATSLHQWPNTRFESCSGVSSLERRPVNSVTRRRMPVKRRQPKRARRRVQSSSVRVARSVRLTRAPTRTDLPKARADECVVTGTQHWGQGADA